MKRYKAVFFDWDGTAVRSRTAPAGPVLPAMAGLLRRGVKLFIISGTTYGNIAGGRLHEAFSAGEVQNLYLGLGRGMLNYGFGAAGGPEMLHRPRLEKETLLRIHRAAYGLHERLLREHDIPSDIVFTRPGYCKLDFMVERDRGEALFLQSGEAEAANAYLAEKGLAGGVAGLLELARQEGEEQGLALRPTSDMKYIELGLVTKADNVDYFWENVVRPAGIGPGETCFWGDEFACLAPGVMGSDAQMITPRTREADFFDVSQAGSELPAGVIRVEGGIGAFRAFLEKQTE